MENVLMIGADVHDRTILAQFAVGRGAVAVRGFRSHQAGRAGMVRFFREWAAQTGATRIVLAYEASASGFGLYDELTEAGIEAYVLAPHKLGRAPGDRKRKTDERDAARIHEVVRGAVLAGNAWPTVWIPDPQTRDDREVVRARLNVSQKATAVKAQVQMLLKRNRLEKPEELGKSWTKQHRCWLADLASGPEPLGGGARSALQSLLRQLAALEAEREELDRALAALAQAPRYAAQVAELLTIKGVKVLVAMVFLTEMGDLKRFKNRREIGCYLGLVPGSWESGEQDDRKGHITRQGSARVRQVLCQATWARIRHDPGTQIVHERLVRKNPNKKKIAVVACMRRLAILMWHRARAVQPASPSAEAAQGTPPTAAPAGRIGHGAREAAGLSGKAGGQDGAGFLRSRVLGSGADVVGRGPKKGRGVRALAAHRAPLPRTTGYPLTGCSPAEPVSVSPAEDRLTRAPAVVKALAASALGGSRAGRPPRVGEGATQRPGPRRRGRPSRAPEDRA